MPNGEGMPPTWRDEGLLCPVNGFELKGSPLTNPPATPPTVDDSEPRGAPAEPLKAVPRGTLSSK